MPETVRVLRKQGAKNREMNQSIKDVMKLILENREKAKQEQINTKKTMISSSEGAQSTEN
jgi:hypothetical protein